MVEKLFTEKHPIELKAKADMKIGKILPNKKNCSSYRKQMYGVRKSIRKESAIDLKKCVKAEFQFNFDGFEEYETNNGDPFSIYKRKKEELLMKQLTLVLYF